MDDASLLEGTRSSEHDAMNAFSPVFTGTGSVVRNERPPPGWLRFDKFFGNGASLWLDMQSDYDLWTSEAHCATSSLQLRSHRAGFSYAKLLTMPISFSTPAKDR